MYARRLFDALLYHLQLVNNEIGRIVLILWQGRSADVVVTHPSFWVLRLRPFLES
jgi:hypothetical protein